MGLLRQLVASATVRAVFLALASALLAADVIIAVVGMGGSVHRTQLRPAPAAPGPSGSAPGGYTTTGPATTAPPSAPVTTTPPGPAPGTTTPTLPMTL